MPTLTSDDMEWLVEFWGQDQDFTVLTNALKGDQAGLYVTTLI